MLQPYKSFQIKFRQSNLRSIYEEKFKNTRLRGIDRLDSSHFSRRSKIELKHISKKSLSGTYKFSPYLELLQGKGRDKAPRVLAIPTLRDRVALHALKEFLFELFPECVNRRFANTFIKELKAVLENENIEDIGFFKSDIKNYYGSINKSKLLKFIEHKTKSKKAILMIKRAISRPIVPKVYSRLDLNSYFVDGIPQGLAISNILAEIYFKEIDQSMSDLNEVTYYCRYVDDILIVAKTNKLAEIVKEFRDNVEGRDGLQLALHPSKTCSNIFIDKNYKISDSFSFLGYDISLANAKLKVAPRRGAEEKFLRSISGMFSEYKKALNNIAKRKWKDDKKNHQRRLVETSFVFRLNIRISGAINENKRYGWIFYFSEITDLSSLYRIDKAIAKFFNRVNKFDEPIPTNLKQISRAYFNAKNNPESNYFHNYNNYNNDYARRNFLLQNGFIEKDKSDRYSNNKIRDMFEKVKAEDLSRLVQDETFLY